MLIPNSSYIKNVIAELKYKYLERMPSDRYPTFFIREYKKRTGQELNLENPQTYTEKMQYAKLHLNSPLKTQLTDKYRVREWVQEKIGEEYLIPLLGVWDKFSEIDFKILPNKFILKTNHSSGWNIIVENKDDLDYQDAKTKMDKWVNSNFAFVNYLQLQYKDIEPKIIAEEYIADSNGDLNDYKFLCFNGEVYYCWVDLDRNDEMKRNVYDLNWQLQPWTQNKSFDNTETPLEKPEGFEEMVEIARNLSEGFSHVRVDLYNVDGKIYFGEMTFTSSGGYSLIHPEEFNHMLGNLWNLEKDKANNIT